MEARPVQLLNFLKSAEQFVVPIYQRTYSWRTGEWQDLWNDVIRSGKDDLISAHFTGSLVYIQSGLQLVTQNSPLLVIDGQQRLTTMTILLEALARAVGDEEPVHGFSSEKIRQYFLLNHLEEGDRRFKLLLTDTDRDSLLALLRGWDWPVNSSLLVRQAFDYFEARIGELGGDFAALCAGLEKLVVVEIALDRSKDNPQLIFESLNSTGRALSQADLIRNFVLMGLDFEDQSDLYRRYWRSMEQSFGQENYARDFDRFMRHYLTFRTGQIPKESEVYEAFKLYAAGYGADVEGVGQLLADVHRFAGFYCSMALGAEQDPDLAAAFRDLRELRVEVAYPLLLQLYDHYDAARVAFKQDFLSCVRMVESYVFRRAVCSIPTNSLNKTFATIGGGLDRERYLDSLKGRLMSLRSYRRFPRDDEFERDLKVRDLYNFPRRSYWLRRIENDGRKESVHVNEYTIEHIMPQNPNLSEGWKSDLGPEWERVRRDWLHTLGNLTLTGYNPEYSDHRFVQKRDMKGGFRKSPLKLNEDLGQLEMWDESAILKRAERLADLAKKVWDVPSGFDEAVGDGPDGTQSSGTYSVDEFQYLDVGGVTRDIFDRFRAEVLSLDPCVSEEFMRRWVAYRAETDFVDVVPLAGGLQLILNMDLHELEDPRDFAEDVTEVGHWGNGNVRLQLRNLDEVPYGLSLVRQALDRQLGDVEVLEVDAGELSILSVAD